MFPRNAGGDVKIPIERQDRLDMIEKWVTRLELSTRNLLRSVGTVQMSNFLNEIIHGILECYEKCT